MAQTPPIIVIGCTNSDVNITPTETLRSTGGGAYFSAIGASLVQKPVGLVTKVGGEFDLTFLLNQVVSDGIRVVPDGRTTQSIQTYYDANDLSKRRIELVDGVSFDLSPADFVDEWQGEVKVVHISTMPPLQQRAFIPFLRQRFPQAQISIDTDSWFFDQPELVQEIAHNFGLVDIVFLNRVESAKFQDLLPQLPHVVTKQDKDGAVVLQFGQEIARAQSPQVKARDATGAGDILAGVYLARLTQGLDPQTALEEAVQMASRSVTQTGLEHLVA